jgi:hypothetical protein
MKMRNWGIPQNWWNVHVTAPLIHLSPKKEYDMLISPMPSSHYLSSNSSHSWRRSKSMRATTAEEAGGWRWPALSSNSLSSTSSRSWRCSEARRAMATGEVVGWRRRRERGIRGGGRVVQVGGGHVVQGGDGRTRQWRASRIHKISKKNWLYRRECHHVTWWSRYEHSIGCTMEIILWGFCL